MRVCFFILLLVPFYSFGQVAQDDDPPLMMVDEKPRFNACERMKGSIDEKKACADNKLLEFIYRSVKYPKKARKNKREGQVYVQFVIEKTGYISGAKVVRDIGDGCGDAVLDALSDMNKLKPPFVPGRQEGKPVRVLYTLPVAFKLAG